MARSVIAEPGFIERKMMADAARRRELGDMNGWQPATTGASVAHQHLIDQLMVNDLHGATATRANTERLTQADLDRTYEQMRRQDWAIDRDRYAYQQQYMYESFSHALQKLLHAKKDIYDKIVHKSKKDNRSIEHIVQEILTMYFEPLKKDDAATQMNKKLGFDKKIIPMVDFRGDEEVPF